MTASMLTHRYKHSAQNNTVLSESAASSFVSINLQIFSTLPAFLNDYFFRQRITSYARREIFIYKNVSRNHDLMTLMTMITHAKSIVKQK